MASAGSVGARATRGAGGGSEATSIGGASRVSNVDAATGELWGWHADSASAVGRRRARCVGCRALRRE